MPSDTERMGGPAINAAVPPERRTSRDPVRNRQSTVPHPEKEDAAYTANPNQISSTRLRLGRSIWAAGVSHHSDTALIADPNLTADTTPIAKSSIPGWSMSQRFHPAHFQEESVRA